MVSQIKQVFWSGTVVLRCSICTLGKKKEKEKEKKEKKEKDHKSKQKKKKKKKKKSKQHGEFNLHFFESEPNHLTYFRDKILEFVSQQYKYKIYKFQ